MTKWERIVDRQIADAIGDGDVSHLPGAGKKLPLNENSSTPDELRAAYKIMADHNVTLDWIEAGTRLKNLESALRNEVERRAQQHQRRLANIEAANRGAAGLKSDWERYRTLLLERVKRYNREVLVYNLTIPKGIPQRHILRGELLLEQALRQDP